MLYKICLIFTCSLFLAVFLEGKAVLDSLEAVNNVVERACTVLSEKYEMKVIGTSIAMPEGIVKELGLHFNVVGPYAIEELRKILIGSSQDFQGLINDSQSLKPFLEVHPFEIGRLEIVLFLINSKRASLQHPDIGRAEITRAELSYSSFTDIKGIPKRQKEVRETYAEALKALE